jgi:hypothetical protein
MKSSLIPIIAAGLFLVTTARTQAGVIVTYAENPNAETSALSNTQLFDFNNLSTGRSTNVSWSGVGTFDQLYIKNADQYGGATDSTHPNGTKYSVQGAGTSVSTTTLSLNEASSYFGFWWSAGDSHNVLDFYKGGNLVGEFNTASLLTPLGSEYDGNPRNRSLNSGEPYAFINFYGDINTEWDKIVFRNNASSGFESDNYTSRVMSFNSNIDSGSVPGNALQRITGTTTTTLSKTATGAALWGAETLAPGAPAPPMPLVAAFGLVLLIKGRKALGKGNNDGESEVLA